MSKLSKWCGESFRNTPHIEIPRIGAKFGASKRACVQAAAHRSVSNVEPKDEVTDRSMVPNVSAYEGASNCDTVPRVRNRWPSDHYRWGIRERRQAMKAPHEHAVLQCKEYPRKGCTDTKNVAIPAEAHRTA